MIHPPHLQGVHHHFKTLPRRVFKRFNSLYLGRNKARHLSLVYFVKKALVSPSPN